MMRAHMKCVSADLCRSLGRSGSRRVIWHLQGRKRSVSHPTTRKHTKVRTAIVAGLEPKGNAVVDARTESEDDSERDGGFERTARSVTEASTDIVRHMRNSDTRECTRNGSPGCSA